MGRYKTPVVDLKEATMLLQCRMWTPTQIGKHFGCSNSYMRKYLKEAGVYFGRESPLERWWNYVSPEPNTGCWYWLGYHNWAGYPLFGPDQNCVNAHRWYYHNHVAPVPDDMDLDHTCKNRGCVNPDHLEVVTHLENMHRGNMLWKDPEWSPNCRVCRKRGTNHAGLCKGCRVPILANKRFQEDEK